MRNILVPIDGSDNSVRALDYAVAQCACYPTTLHLLKVEPALDDYGMVRGYVSKNRHHGIMKAHAETVLRKAARRIKSKTAFKIHFAMGDASAAIVATARRLRCEAIVMGTRGMGSFGNLLLGSVASKVIHHTRLPVTLVK